MSALSTPAPHPLAQRLIDWYAGRAGGAVIEIAAGSGRNTRALVAAGVPVVSTRDDDSITQLPGTRANYAAALSTHGYLHGTVAKLRVALGELRRVLEHDAPIFITLGSIADARYGFGVPLDERTFAPGDGPERGIPHAYFDRAGVEELLSGFAIAAIDEVEVDAIVGRWAHDDDETGLRHWFVHARNVAPESEAFTSRRSG